MRFSVKSPTTIARDSLVGINCYGLGELRLNNWRHGELDLSFVKRKINECLEQYLSILGCLMSSQCFLGSLGWVTWTLCAWASCKMPELVFRCFLEIAFAVLINSAYKELLLCVTQSHDASCTFKLLSICTFCRSQCLISGWKETCLWVPNALCVIKPVAVSCVCKTGAACGAKPWWVE